MRLLAGENAIELPSTMDRQLNPQQIQCPPHEFQTPLDIPSLTASERKVYDDLRAHGWSEDACSDYIRNVKSLQDFLVQAFRAQGWSEDQLKAFNEYCDSKLPEQFSTPPNTDYEWQLFLIDEQNRRQRIAEEMGLSITRFEN